MLPFPSIHISPDWVGAIAGVASAVTSYFSLRIVMGLRDLNASSLQMSVADMKRRRRLDAAEDADSVHAQLRAVMRTFAQLQLDLNNSIQTGALLTFSGAMTEATALSTDISRRFPELSSEADVLWRECSQVLNKCNTFYLDSSAKSNLDWTPVAKAMIDLHTSLYKMHKKIDKLERTARHD